MAKYETIQDGKFYKLPRKDKVMCCDCGLVHLEEYQVRGRDIYVRLTRDNRATGQARRHMRAK